MPPSPSLHTRGCARGLFAPVDVEIDVRKDPALVRQRAVTVDFAQFDGSADRLTLNLFADLCLVAVRDTSSVPEPGGNVWTGAIDGVPHSSVTFVTSNRTLIGTVISPPNAFQVRLLREGVHLVNQVDPSRYPNEKQPK